MDKLITPQVDDIEVPPGPLNFNVALLYLQVRPYFVHSWPRFGSTNHIEIRGMGVEDVYKGLKNSSTYGSYIPVSTGWLIEWVQSRIPPFRPLKSQFWLNRHQTANTILC